MTTRRRPIDTQRDHDRLARLIIEAGFSTTELVAIARESAGIDFQEIARAYQTYTEQLAGLLRAAELRRVYDELVTGLIQARADNPTIQAAIIGTDIGMQSQNEQQQQINIFALLSQINSIDARLGYIERRLQSIEIAAQLKVAAPVNWTIIVIAAIAALAIGLFLYLVGTGRI